MVNLTELLKKGLALHSNRDLEGAAKYYQEILEYNPNHADALNLMGTVEGQKRRYALAIKFIEAAIRLEPAEPAYRNNLGHALLMANEPQLALKQLEEAVRLSPRFVAALCNLSKALETCGKIDEAIEILRRAAELNPSNKQIFNSLLELDRRVADGKQVVTKLRQLLVANPNDLRSIMGVLMAEKATIDTLEIGAAERLLGSATLSREQRSDLMHALGKAYDDIGRYDDAFRLVLEAKSLANVSYDISKHVEWLQKTTATFTKMFFAERKGLRNESEIPVFIVGMPRSGTTLTEQIVASHPKAMGAGELPHISRISSIIGATSTQLEIDTAKLFSLSDQNLEQLANAYLERLGGIESGKSRVTDKSPLNLRYLGTIALLFRNAKIIHCRRDPRDTCLSIFLQRFKKGHYYSYDLKSLGQYHRLCDELMDHWKDTVPLDILDVEYELTISDLEKQARKIISFIGLEWNDSCLNFRQAKRAVTTASQWQVRQPLYNTSVGRWKHYEKYLEPLFQGLESSVLDS